jgi:hypothetical protein
VLSTNNVITNKIHLYCNSIISLEMTMAFS